MKKVFILIVALCLTLVGCSTKTDKVSQEKERMLAFLTVNNVLYVIGEKNDYQFSGEYLEKFDRFMKSNYTKYIQKAAVAIKITDSTNVRIYYKGFLGEVPEKDKQAIHKEYGIANNGSVYFLADGQLVKLQNREEILAKNPVKGKFFADVAYYESSADLAQDIENILMIPVTVVAFLPTMIIWGMIACAEKENGC